MNNFKEKFKLYFKKRTQRISLSGLSVAYDWYLILLFLTALTCVGLVAAVFSYRDISNGTVFEGSETSEVPSATKQKNEDIEKVVEHLKQR